MNILICNDDGIHAPGINTLAEILSEIAEVTVVAPLEERSTTGHTLTLDHPLRVSEIKKNYYGISGYPADCGMMGVAHFFKDKKLDLVVSGINRGANLGQDIYYSGTVAAAREASFHNVPAVSVSTVLDLSKHFEGEVHFRTAALFIKKLIECGIHKNIDNREVINVNVPNIDSVSIKGVKVTDLGFRKYAEEIEERIDFRDRKYYWIGGRFKGDELTPGSDCEAISKNEISLTSLSYFNVYEDRKSSLQKFVSNNDLTKFF